MPNADKTILWICLSLWYLFRLSFRVVSMGVAVVFVWLAFNGLVLLTTYFTTSGEPWFCAGALTVTKKAYTAVPWSWLVVGVVVMLAVFCRAVYKDMQRQTEKRFFPDTKNDPFSWYRDD